MQDIVLNGPEAKKPWEGFELQRPEELRPELSLKDFQQYSVYQSLLKNRYITGLPTGCGKTLIAITSFFFYRKVYPKTKLIIVTNNSAIFQYANEIDKFFIHSFRVQVVHDSAKEFKGKKYPVLRKECIKSYGTVLNGSVDILVFNYPIFRIERKEILNSIQNLKRSGWSTFLILDEMTNFKNMSTQTFKAVHAIQAYCDKVLGATATLSKGKIEEMYPLYKGIGLLLANSKAEFESRYCITWQSPKFIWLKVIKGYKNIEELKDRIAPYTIILKKSDIAASLPSFQIQKRILDHSDEQKELIREIYSGIISVGNSEITSENLFGDNVKILQQLSEQGYVKRALQSPEIVLPDRYTDCSPKIEEILSMLEDDFTDEKIIIYTPSKKFLHLLLSKIKKTKSVPDFYRKPLEISGDVSAQDRFEYVNKFTNSPEYNILILDKAGTEALNLQAASVLIVCSMPDSYGDLVQLVGRCSRIGSKHTHLLLIYLLHKNSMDESEYEIIHQQGVLFQAIHGEVENGLLDTSVLRSAEHEGMSDEDFVSKSVKYLLLSKRSSLMQNYL